MQARRVRCCAAVVLVCAVAVGSSAPAATAAATTAGDVGGLVLVLDASGSMLEPGRSGARKIDEAKTALTRIASRIPAGTPVGLRVFGTGAAARASRQSCRDSRLLVPVGRTSARRLAAAARPVRARGWTPIGFALEQAVGDLGAAGHGTVVLVSDGRDECHPTYGREPCAVARELRDAPVRLTVHAIGFAVDDTARTQLRCIAKAAGGRYWDADDTDDLSAALRASLAPAPLPPPAAPPRPDRTPLLLALVGVAGGLAAATSVVRSVARRRARMYW